MSPTSYRAAPLRDVILRHLNKECFIIIFSEIDIISSMCMLMARGAVISMLAVIFVLPALLLLCDKLICATTAGMRQLKQSKNSNMEVYAK